MFKFTYIAQDNEDGNPDRSPVVLFNTDDPYVALAMALKEVKWTMKNIKQALEDEPRLMQEFLSGKNVFPASEILDQEEIPHWSIEDCQLVPLKNLRIELDVLETDTPNTLFARAQKQLTELKKSAFLPTSAELALARKLRSAYPAPMDVNAALDM